MRYRAEIFIRGSTLEKVYRKTMESVENNAIEKLTAFKPGMMSIYPVKAVIYERVTNDLGETVDWVQKKVITYEELSEDQHAWRRKEREQNS